MSLSAIQRIEKGTREPRLANVDKIANVLGVSASALFSSLPGKITPIEALNTLADHLSKCKSVE
jgi:transcriptional regulator with XRE-family HTH domain